MQLIDNWKAAPKMYVVQILATIAVVQGVWAELPPDVVAMLPPQFVHYATAALAAVGVLVRILKQFQAPDVPDEPPAQGTTPKDPSP